MVEVSSSDLTVVGPYSDRNTRGVLKARVVLPNKQNVDEPLYLDVFNTHLTYDDKQQCPMIVKLLEYLDQEYITDINQIILGDLNTYLTFEWPIDFLEDPFSPLSKSQYNPCHEPFSSWITSQSSSTKNYFLDVWKEAFPRNYDGSLVSKGSKEELIALGHTFPAFKDSALTNCRPDRILRRQSNLVELLSVATFGDEPYYESTHLNPIPLYLSDHLGIQVSLNFLSKN